MRSCPPLKLLAMVSLVLSIIVAGLWWKTYHKHWYEIVWNGPYHSLTLVADHEQVDIQLLWADHSHWASRFEFLHENHGLDDYYVQSFGPNVHAWSQSIPYEFPFLAFLVLPILWVRKYRAILRTAQKNRCIQCGYDLRSTPDRCPECGADRVSSNLSFIQPGQRFEMVTLVVVITVGALMILILGRL